MVRQHLANTACYSLICSTDNDIIWQPIMNDLTRQRYDLMREMKCSFNLKRFLLYSKCVLPLFHTLPKLHKPGKTGCPIVGAVDWITTPFSKYLSMKLEEFPVERSLKNSIQLLGTIENIRVADDSILITFDVESLYTNMDIDRLIDVVISRTRKPMYGKILSFICRSNYFVYGNDIYHQTNGIAMGTNCAVHCANIYMEYIDTVMSQQPGTSHYYRFIDDGFWINTNDSAYTNQMGDTITPNTWH